MLTKESKQQSRINFLVLVFHYEYHKNLYEIVTWNQLYLFTHTTFILIKETANKVEISWGEHLYWPVQRILYCIMTLFAKNVKMVVLTS